jgi:arylamine N-acetyltransferase
MTTFVNQNVDVDAFFFKGTDDGKGHSQLASFPRRIELGNTQYTFKDGLRFLARKGQHIVQLFDMTDGQTTYRLRFDNEDEQGNKWTLIGTRSANMIEMGV